MMRNSPNLTLSMPKCRHCARHWRPGQGVVAAAAHCKKCSKERHEVAIPQLGLKRISLADLTGDYLPPRRFRAI
jgi:hypothetical protein